MIKLRIALANKDATAAQRDELKRIIGQHLPIVEIKPQPGQILASLDWHVLLGDIVNIITVSGWIWTAYTKLAARRGGRLIVMAKGEKSHDWENFVLEHDNQSTPEEFAGKFSSAILRIHESERNDIPDDHADY